MHEVTFKMSKGHFGRNYGSWPSPWRAGPRGHCRLWVSGFLLVFVELAFCELLACRTNQTWKICRRCCHWLRKGQRNWLCNWFFAVLDKLKHCGFLIKNGTWNYIYPENVVYGDICTVSSPFPHSTSRIHIFKFKCFSEAAPAAGGKWYPLRQSKLAQNDSTKGSSTNYFFAGLEKESQIWSAR